MNVVSPLSLAFVGSIFCLAGCAQGSTIGTGGSGGGDGGSGSGTSSKSSVASSGHASTTVGSTTSAVSSGSGGGSGGGMPCDFTPDNSCAAAQGLPSVSGDNGGSAMATGSGSHWVQVHITENDSSIFSTKDLSYTVTLTSPAGMVYSVFVHESGDGASGPACGATAKQGTPNNGAVQTVHSGWSDTQGLGGIDNSRWISVEVRYISGMDCNATWTLGIVGAT